jgi:choice-of-anchor B domain-containing protein
MTRTSLTAAVAVLIGTSAVGAQTHYREDAGALVQFGAAIAFAGDELFIGEIATSTDPGGVVHVYRRSGNAWRSGATLKLEGANSGTRFGTSIATDGTTLLVGMRRGAPTDSVRGGVQVFTRGANGAWTDAGALGGVPAARSSFGAAVAVAGDWAFVGAPGGSSGGAVHVFRKSGGRWTEAGTLPATDLNAGDRFGSAISVDGDRVAVSAPGRDVQKGAVFVYRRGADGSWTQEASLGSRRATTNAQVGSTLLLKGDKIWAGGATASSFVGMVVGFQRNASGSWAETVTLTPFETITNRFGAALAMVGDELWIGAPFSDSRQGRVYRATFNADGGLTGMVKFGGDSLVAGSGFGNAIAVSGNNVAIAMPSDAGGEGTVQVYSRSTSGDWRLTGHIYPQPTQTLAAITGGEKACAADGSVNGFGCSNTSLLSFLPIRDIGGRRGTNLNDNWGWTDSTTGREYALVGRTDGTSFVDVTDPTRPRYLGDLPLTKGANPAAWRDVKVYKNHAFIVADGAGAHGVQVFDLTRLRSVREPQTFTEDVVYDRVGSAHNIVMNEETGFAYAVGVSGSGDTCGGGLHMIDVRNPKNPTFAGCFSDPATGRAGTGYSHDAQCIVYRGPDEQYKGREICIGSNETAISIADVTDKSNPKAISHASYPAVAYAHQGWLTDDHRYFYLGDELDETAGEGEAGKGTRTLIWDLQDLDDPVLLKEFVGTTPATDHNLYIKGNRMYQANYQAGLRILDISDPANPREVGYLDTTPEGTTPQMSGTWSNYPYFSSGTIVVTSIGEGLFLVRDRTQSVP